MYSFEVQWPINNVGLQRAIDICYREEKGRDVQMKNVYMNSNWNNRAASNN